MEIIRPKRVHHHGILAGAIKDPRISELIDSYVGRHPDENISAGEAVADLIINRLDLTNKPMTLPPSHTQVF